MRRLVREGVNDRFVTGERLEAMLKVRGPSHSVPSLGLILYRRKHPTSSHLVPQSIWTVP